MVLTLVWDFITWLKTPIMLFSSRKVGDIRLSLCLSTQPQTMTKAVFKDLCGALTTSFNTECGNVEQLSAHTNYNPQDRWYICYSWIGWLHKKNISIFLLTNLIVKCNIARFWNDTNFVYDLSFHIVFTIYILNECFDLLCSLWFNRSGGTMRIFLIKNIYDRLSCHFFLFAMGHKLS